MKRSSLASNGASQAPPSSRVPAASASTKLKRPSSLAELRDRQRTTKMAKTEPNASVKVRAGPATAKEPRQSSIASFFSPSPSLASSSLVTGKIANGTYQPNIPASDAKSARSSAPVSSTKPNPFRPVASATRLVTISSATFSTATQVIPRPLKDDQGVGDTDHVNDATRPYQPPRQRRDPLALLRSISIDAPGSLSDSDDNDDVNDQDAPPLALDISSLIKSVASLGVCVQGTTLALDTRESAYRSQVDIADEDTGLAGGDQDDEGDAWGDAAMSSSDEYDQGDKDGAIQQSGDHGPRPAWFDALLQSKLHDNRTKSAASLPSTAILKRPTLDDPTPPPPPERNPSTARLDASLLDLLDLPPEPLGCYSNSSALALPRRLTFTSTDPTTCARLLIAFSATVDPISDPCLLATAFSAFASDILPTTGADSAAALVAHLHHYRYPPMGLPPATRQVLARALAASTSWPPLGASGDDIAWYMQLVTQWQAALGHLTAAAPSQGFVVMQARGAAGTAGTPGAGFVVAVQGDAQGGGAYVAHASRGMRKALVLAGVTGMRGVAGPGMLGLAEEEDQADKVGLEEGATAKGKTTRGGKLHKGLARQYVVDYDGDEDDDDGGARDRDDQGTGSDVEQDTPPSALDPCMDPTRTSVLYIPPESTPALLAFLHDWPTTYNLQSAHAPDPELPVLLCAEPFVHASADAAKVTKCGQVSSAVHGEKVVRVQVDGWVLPHKVREVMQVVMGDDQADQVHVGVTWEDGCGLVKTVPRPRAK